MPPPWRASFISKITRRRLRSVPRGGVALLALAEAGLPIYEYAPRRVKAAATGRGGAQKAQVSFMMRADARPDRKSAARCRRRAGDCAHPRAGTPAFVPSRRKFSSLPRCGIFSWRRRTLERTALRCAALRRWIVFDLGARFFTRFGRPTAHDKSQWATPEFK